MKTNDPANLQQSGDKPQIDYPCSWMYTVIGENQHLLQEVIVLACAPAKVEISYSHASSGGRYHSLKASLTVDSEAERLSIYQQLQSHPAVKIVL